MHTVFPRIVSALEYIPPLNSFRGFQKAYEGEILMLMYCDLWTQYIQVRKLFKGGNYSRKYGMHFFFQKVLKIDHRPVAI